MSNANSITIPVAKALKEIGYNEPCNTSFTCGGEEYPAPGWVGLAIWLWEKRGQWIELRPDGTAHQFSTHHDTYEAAFLCAISEIKYSQH